MEVQDVNKQAVAIAKHFFDASKRRATAGTMKTSIGQAKYLLNSNFTQEEITDVIDYLLKHQPKNGLHSLGFLSYVMEDVLIKIKANAVKKTFTLQDNITSVTDETKPTTHNKVESKQQRIGSEFDTNIF